MNKVAVVTGATSGIGKAVVLRLIKEDVTVIALGRSDEKINKLDTEMKPFIKNNCFYIVKGDLSDQESIKDVAIKINQLIEKHTYQIDYLIHVAGRVTSGYHVNKDHREMTFAVNHLAVVSLTHLLFKQMKESLDSRILVVSSQSHYRANINFDNLETKTFYTILRSYKRSKLYNVLFVKGFAERFKKIPIFAIDPGVVKTNIGKKHTSKLVGLIWKWRSSRGIHPQVAASHMYDVLTEKKFNEISGAYVKHGEPVSSNPVTYKKDVVDKMWDITLEMLDIKIFFEKKDLN